MALLPAVCPDPAGARQEGDAEPLRPQDDPRLRRVHTPPCHTGTVRVGKNKCKKVSKIFHIIYYFHLKLRKTKNVQSF